MFWTTKIMCQAATPIAWYQTMEFSCTTNMRAGTFPREHYPEHPDQNQFKQSRFSKWFYREVNTGSPRPRMHRDTDVVVNDLRLRCDKKRNRTRNQTYIDFLYIIVLVLRHRPNTPMILNNVSYRQYKRTQHVFSISLIITTRLLL